jgi:hypothetical protein
VDKTFPCTHLSSRPSSLRRIMQRRWSSRPPTQQYCHGFIPILEIHDRRAEPTTCILVRRRLSRASIHAVCGNPSRYLPRILYRPGLCSVASFARRACGETLAGLSTFLGEALAGNRGEISRGREKDGGKKGEGEEMEEDGGGAQKVLCIIATPLLSSTYRGDTGNSAEPSAQQTVG